MSRKLLVPFQLPANPTQALEAATKQYVDAQNEVIVAAADPIGSNPQAELWIDTVTNPPAAPLASAISFSPTGTIAATNVQTAVAEVANEAPRGIVAWKQGALTGFALTATAQTIATITAAIVAGRMYELIVNWRAFTSSAGAPIYWSSTISPTIAGFSLDDYTPYTATYCGSTIIKTFAGPTTATYTFTIKANVTSGTGSLWNEQGGGMWIKDIGLAVASQ